MELMDIDEVGADPTTAPTTALAPAERAALALESSKTEQYLKTLATKHTGITVVKDKAGREQAHGAYMELMRARTAIKKAGKEARDDATKFSQAVIKEENRLVSLISAEENRLQAVRDTWDAEQARIKAEAEAKERARVLAELKAQEAEQARIKAEQEAEAARLKAEREELSRQRAEAEAEALVKKQQAELAAQRAAAEAEALVKKQQAELAAQRAAAEAEVKRVADEARAQAEAAEAKARAAAEEMAAQRAELERMRAELEAKSKPAEQEQEADEILRHPNGAPVYSTTTFRGDGKPIMLDQHGKRSVFCDLDEGPGNAPVPTRQPPAPVASAIVLAVAEFWHTDNKTAARWITERAAEIESLR